MGPTVSLSYGSPRQTFVCSVILNLSFFELLMQSCLDDGIYWHFNSVWILKQMNSFTGTTEHTGSFRGTNYSTEEYAVIIWRPDFRWWSQPVELESDEPTALGIRPTNGTTRINGPTTWHGTSWTISAKYDDGTPWAVWAWRLVFIYDQTMKHFFEDFMWEDSLGRIYRLPNQLS